MSFAIGVNFTCKYKMYYDTWQRICCDGYRDASKERIVLEWRKRFESDSSKFQPPQRVELAKWTFWLGMRTLLQDLKSEILMKTDKDFPMFLLFYTPPLPLVYENYKRVFVFIFFLLLWFSLQWKPNRCFIIVLTCHRS